MVFLEIEIWCKREGFCVGKVMDGILMERSEESILSPTIMEVDNYRNLKETTIGDTPIFHFNDYGRKGK